MEREREIRKLTNVLIQTARMAFQSEWTGSGSNDAAALCVDRHNRILVRLKEHEPEIAAVFEPLAADCSLMTAAIACRQLASYFEDETGWSSRWKHAYSNTCDPKAFKEFWRKSAKDVQDLGEYMRECAEEWARRRKAKAEAESPPTPPPASK
jgi:cytochrome P450